MDFTWALNYPEIHKICSLFRLHELNTPVKYSYKSLKQITQDGPQCGPVALAMLLNDEKLIDEIVNEAKLKQYTFNGEIFSANDMAELVKNHLNVVEVRVFEGSLNCEEIKLFLLNGGLMLVPFDVDKDKSPGLYNGDKAHWAVVCGGVETKDDFYVIARHGTAVNVCIWKLDKLAKSNQQLFEFSNARKLSGVSYKLPNGGIAGAQGLNCKSVLIKLP